MPARIEHDARVSIELSLRRLDHVAAALFPQYSRSRLQQWIDSGELTVDGENRKPKYKVSAGAMLRIAAQPELSSNSPEAIALDIVYEDAAVLVVNKAAGLVVHPGAGNQGGTLLNALLHHDADLEAVPRAGIVHRLDKDTTGLMVVAKTLSSQNRLVQQLQDRTVKRVYEAVTYGVIGQSGTVDAPIGRHSHNRTRMSIQTGGREAITHYRPLRQFKHFSHLELSLETGRTHQIRVHMQHLRHPLIGDPTYGGTFRQPPGQSNAELVDYVRSFPRQALHARQLSFVHPDTGQAPSFTADLPDDMGRLLELLLQHESS